MRYGLIILLVAGIVMILCLFTAIRSGESGVKVLPNSSDVTVTLDTPGVSPLAAADSLKEAFNLKEAIELYKAASADKSIDIKYRKEAEFDIGVCKYWLGDKEAETIFKELPVTYSDDSDLKGFREHCLALIDIQNGDYNGAIERLKVILSDKTYTDKELYARTLFQIGKTYLCFLDDRANAKIYFKRVASEYPESEIAGHPYVTGK